MKKLLILATALLVMAAGCGTKYETVKDDPMQTKICTLDNGLKIFMTVNKDEPRIQTFIAVKVGGKNDPADNTGLAHYLEHMMFKGSEQFGTSDYAAEKPMLAAVDSLFEVYRTKTDPAERAAIYHQIDSISYEASKIAIPNEYDKLMSIIGSDGSNAFTSNDVTCYTEDIPANQVEAWAKIEADRFKNCVFRGFHTELEAVYEEKNMGLVDDQEKALDALDSMLFRHHPYGTQTVIGTQDHLKNPSLRTIRSHKDTYYVPNNVAICLSGDFNPDEMVATIQKYFGDWQPNPALPAWEITPEEPAAEPMVKDVVGEEAEFVMMGWRTPGDKTTDSEVADIAGSLLYNGMAGLIDLNVNQRQRVLQSYVFPYGRVDYGTFIALGMPKAGQSLVEVKDILLAEVEKLAQGEFSDDLLRAVINNQRLDKMRSLESNRSRAMQFVNAFISDTPWDVYVGKDQRMAAVTKEDVMKWAGEYLTADKLAVVYKHIGKDNSIKKIEAPKITPIVTNRDMQSEFLQAVAAAEVKPIEPIFLDYEKDMRKATFDGLPFLYKKNIKNQIASITYRFNRGTADDPALKLAADYVQYLGTADKTADDIASEMYGLACDFSIRVGANATTIRVSGLAENIVQAAGTVEDLVRGAVGDEDILASLKADLIKERADDKLNMQACNSALRRYVMYGPELIKKTTLTNDAVMALTSDELLAKAKDLLDCYHRILYYGPEEFQMAEHQVDVAHDVYDDTVVESDRAVTVPTPQTAVFIAPYKSRQFNYMQYSCRGEKLSVEDDAAIALFNEYFGGGMNAIVFQEMRESRALAYSAGAWLGEPSWKEDNYTFRAMIGSQNDKLQQAVEAFDSIIEEMPVADANLEIARGAIETRLRTERHNGEDVLYQYINDEELGVTENRDKKIFEKISSLTMDDLKATHAKWIKGRTYVYALTGDPDDMDMGYLRKLGPVKVLSLEEIFGY
ncbi:MAG: insulinase family protein [Bacteroidales bacterium]|nr:insulinase family protein [Bacteroidales bacterium]